MIYQDFKISDLEKMYLQAKEDYYNNSGSNLSDDEYDELEQYLKSKGSNIVIIVGSNNNSVYTIKHLTSMLSLEKIQYVKSFPIDDWNFWLNKAFANSSLKRQMLFTPKLDGSSCKLVYENGKLISAATRGNGSEGRDILDKMYHIVPLELPIGSYPIGKTEVIGEVVISSRVFQNLQKQYEIEGLKVPKNERNYVAGILNSKSATLNEIAKLSFVAFETRKNSGISCNLRRLDSMGFEIPGFKIFTSTDKIEEVYAQFKEFRESSEYLLDGFVGRITDPQLVEELGEGSHHPNWSLAIKFEPTVKSTVVKNIKWQFSQSGRFTPVLEIEPTELGGSTISNVTGNNISFLRKNGIGIGAKITVFKSGEIIPKVGDILIQSNFLNCPIDCPHCGTKLTTSSKNQSKEDVHLICPNKICVGLLPHKMNQALKRLDIKRIGPAIVEKLIAAGYPTLIDLLTTSQEDLAEYLVDSGEFQNGRNLEIVLEALNIKGLTIEEIILITGIDALGTTAAPQIANLFEGRTYDFSGLNSEITLPFENKNSELYKLVSENISRFEKIGKLKKTVISNLKNICLTGSPKDFGFKNKEDFMNSISGYKDTSLDKTCIALITDDLKSTSSKMKKADKLKIPIYTYSEFLKIV